MLLKRNNKSAMMHSEINENINPKFGLERQNSVESVHASDEDDSEDELEKDDEHYFRGRLSNFQFKIFATAMLIVKMSYRLRLFLSSFIRKVTEKIRRNVSNITKVKHKKSNLR